MSKVETVYKAVICVPFGKVLTYLENFDEKGIWLCYDVENAFKFNDCEKAEKVFDQIEAPDNAWIEELEDSEVMEDDGPLTHAQYEAIRAVSPATDTPEELFTHKLF